MTPLETLRAEWPADWQQANLLECCTDTLTVKLEATGKDIAASEWHVGVWAIGCHQTVATSARSLAVAIRAARAAWDMLSVAGSHRIIGEK